MRVRGGGGGGGCLRLAAFSPIVLVAALESRGGERRLGCGRTGGKQYEDLYGGDSSYCRPNQ